MVREATANDLHGLLELYLHLHETRIPDDNCLIVPNLTRNVRPFALVEYVVTHGEYRNRGYAGLCLSYAKELAIGCNCYKIMLVTGSKDPKTLHFYESCGYSSRDKTAFVQTL